MSNVKKIDQITEQQINATGVVSLATRPNQRQANSQYGVGGLSAKELQKRFDNLARLAIGRYNVLAQLLAGTYESVNAEEVESILEYILAIKGDTEGNTVGDLSLKEVLDRILTEDGELKVRNLSLKDILDRILTEDNELKVLNPYAAINSPIKLNTVIAEIVSDISKNAQYITSLATDIETNGQNIYILEEDLLEFRDTVNNILNSDDTTLDQLHEIVAYIKSNKSLIDAITTSKISFTDIVDNLKTNDPNKPLSAAQGVALKRLIETSGGGGGSGGSGGSMNLVWSDTYDPNRSVWGFEIASLSYYSIEEDVYIEENSFKGVKVFNLYGNYENWLPIKAGQIDAVCSATNSDFEEFKYSESKELWIAEDLSRFFIEWDDYGGIQKKSVAISRWLQPTAAEGDLTAVFDELHDYAQEIISGVSE